MFLGASAPHSHEGRETMRTAGLGFVVVALIITTLAPTIAKAHYTPGKRHEHTPTCQVLKYEDRNTTRVRRLRASFIRRGCKLEYDGHCWVCPQVAPRQCR